jgi:putative PIN family toxin of toxin-antitoxin system
VASKSPENCVFDTNTLVSAYLFPELIPGQALAAALQHGRLLASLETVAELTQVLRRSKFDRYLSQKRREELLATTVIASDMIEVTSVVRDCPDPKDDKFLELAVDGNATTIITGDAGLLGLHPWRGIQILTSREYLTYMQTWLVD